MDSAGSGNDSVLLLFAAASIGRRGHGETSVIHADLLVLPLRLAKGMEVVGWANADLEHIED